MRKIKVLSAVLLIIFITLQLFGCKVELSQPKDISSMDEAISMDFYAKDSNYTMKVGEFTWMDVNIKINYEYALEWSSSNPKVATVDSSGRVDAVSVGTATITAKAKKASVDFTVNVIENKADKISMTNALTANSTALTENMAKDDDAKLYRLLINTRLNCMYVYTYNNNGSYDLVVKSMVCSVGKNNFEYDEVYTIKSKDRWMQEGDGKFYQYYTLITSDTEELAFSSSSYESQSESKLITEDFNKLGTAYTDGNIRFCADDAKWIYENCPEGTAIKFTTSTKPSIGKPEALKFPEKSKNAGWDPTDSHEDNPFNKKKPYFTGADDTYVAVNGVFDVYQDVVAYDTCGSVATGKMVVDGNVICSKEGKYVVTYRYTDSLGRTGRKDRVVTVVSAVEYSKLTEPTNID